MSVLNFMFIIFLMFFMLLTLENHFLMMLIGVEFLMVMLMFFLLNYIKINEWFFLVYLVFSVCEAVLGLSLMVSMMFEFGHQKIGLMNLFK
uniref:NADH dehydrogenase subunit 4L n=1 Tax=Tetrapedia diversipes TaxID=889126 RepID=UPI001EF9CD8F|nr:NADH dehydrogenase subunit 4L [Tetrapedia diversipes]UKG21062.1 NADH dehydrogenase subunit 4L [Tetrapedia diversipes]